MSTSQTDHLFHPFHHAIEKYSLPEELQLLHDGAEPHPLCRLATGELQEYLEVQTDWKHNFGLNTNLDSAIIGKMFGVLIVKTENEEIGYLAAFSGKLAGGNHHAGFVPTVFDGLTEGSYLNRGMIELSRINALIREMDSTTPEGYQQVQDMKIHRRNHSNALQNRLFEDYKFINADGVEKSLRDIFNPHKIPGKNPPAGAGECAGIKLLQYAFKHKMKPLALTEFWWGQSSRSPHWKHGEFYTCCKEKCEPILGFMLS